MEKSNLSNRKLALPVMTGLLVTAAAIAGIWMMQSGQPEAKIAPLAGNTAASDNFVRSNGRIVVQPRDVAAFVTNFDETTARLSSGREVDLLAAVVQSADDAKGIWIGTNETDRVLIQFDRDIPQVETGDFVNIRGTIEQSAGNASGHSQSAAQTSYIQATKWEKVDRRSNYQM